MTPSDSRELGILSGFLYTGRSGTERDDDSSPWQVQMLAPFMAFHDHDCNDGPGAARAEHIRRGIRLRGMTGKAACLAWVQKTVFLCIITASKHVEQSSRGTSPCSLFPWPCITPSLPGVRQTCQNSKAHRRNKPRPKDGVLHLILSFRQ